MSEIIISCMVPLYVIGNLQVNIFYLMAIPLSTAIIFFIIDGIIAPTLFSIPFACGYTLIFILNINWTKARARPLHAIKEIIKRFLSGLFDNMTSIGVITKCRYGEWVYEPPFKIKKESKP